MSGDGANVSSLTMFTRLPWAMAQPYLQNLTDLLTQAAPRPRPKAAIACKHFFSGAAAYADERIFMSWTPVGLALKLPEVACAELRTAGAKPLRYFPEGPIKKDYVVVPARLARDAAALRPWIARGIAFARGGGKTGRRRIRSQSNV